LACHQLGVSWLWTCLFGGGDRSPRRGGQRRARRVVPWAQARSIVRAWSAGGGTIVTTA